MKPPKFTAEQVDWICSQIGDWYLNYKLPMVLHKEGCPGCDCRTHILGIAKEHLKIMICPERPDGEM